MPRVNPQFARRLEGIVPMNTGPTKSFQDIQLVVERAQSLSGSGEESASTVGTICTSECISTASSVCATGINDLAATDPAVAQAVAVLHDRAIEKLGVDGLARAMVEVSRAKP